MGLALSDSSLNCILENKSGNFNSVRIQYVSDMVWLSLMPDTSK